MKKEKRRFVCQTCGAEYPRWVGKCEVCGSWNSVLEEIGMERFSSKLPKTNPKYNSPIPITQVKSVDTDRISLGFSEIDLLFGGGIVLGSLTLLAGEPGVGKSTLILEFAKKLSSTKKILYISGEESASQIRLRAERIGAISENILISSELIAENIADMIYHEKPNIVFIDSIQTISRNSLQGIAGTITQLRESTQFFLEIAKTTSIPIFLVGHITKEGTIAGPKVLEHIVDVVLYFESDRLNLYRILRSTKNRFGAVGNVTILEMQAKGLIEVKDRDKVFITQGQKERIGSIISAVMEGTRSICVEIQALVARTYLPQARRMGEGLDNRRIILLCAVLEKYLEYKLSECDVFTNLTGGLNFDEPALDLGICAAILSSYLNKKISHSFGILGEVGLSGEVRPIHSINSRIQELNAIGIQKILVPKGNEKEILLEKNINVFKILHISELNSFLFNTGEEIF